MASEPNQCRPIPLLVPVDDDVSPLRNAGTVRWVYIPKDGGGGGGRDPPRIIILLFIREARQNSVLVAVLHHIIARCGDQEICSKLHFQNNDMQATEYTER